MELDHFQFDSKAKEQGVWKTLSDGTRFRIASMKSKAFLRARQLAAAEEGIVNWVNETLQCAKLENTGDPEKIKQAHQRYDKLKTIQRKAMANTILLGWEKLTFKGKELKYSKEKCTEIFLDEDFDHFVDLILSVAQNEEHYRAGAIEDEKKLRRASSPSSPKTEAKPKQPKKE